MTGTTSIFGAAVTEDVAGSTTGGAENSKLESCSCKRAVCCFSASVSGTLAIGDGGGGTTSGVNGFASNSAGAIVALTVRGGTTNAFGGSRNEACDSDTRGESNVTGTGVSSFSSGGLNLISGIVVTGAIGVTGTAGTNGVTVGKLSGAAGSKDEDREELSRAVGATSFCSTCSSPT